ncbi:hypothetical protein CMI46_01845, partial [Candidatus Pacearchaeota archaeon]|nr:hypothetical protein [Candidatus Pacearchaeota archaeon]
MVKRVKMRTFSRKSCKLVFVILLVVNLSFLVLAVDDLLALQGNVLEGGVNLETGNVTVYIFDAVSAGNVIYNSSISGELNDSISSGKYDIMLGNSSSNELSLKYGDVYYIEMYVNDEQLTFGGAQRQVFQSSVGNISSVNINWTNDVTLPVGKNFTTSSTGWFKGLFNWTISSLSLDWLSFDGASVIFNQTHFERNLSDVGVRVGLNTTANIFNQDLNTTNAVTFATVDTGNGAMEINSIAAFTGDQNLGTGDGVTFATVDTGFGANELYDMDQHVLTTSDVTFADLNVTGWLNISGAINATGAISAATLDTG